MNKDATIIYYSSGREDPVLEKNVKENILKVSVGLPIISVTQFPTDFGQNICVGDRGVSGFNMFRQVFIALLNVQTKYVISAEADCLYPASYFQFEPNKDNSKDNEYYCYRTSDLYVMPDKRAFFFHKKEGATHAQVIDAYFYFKRLEDLFKDAPDWSVEEKNFPKERGFGVDVFEDSQIEYFNSDPVVQVKTHKGMRYYTHSDRTPIYNLPYWGDSKEFRKKYYE